MEDYRTSYPVRIGVIAVTTLVVSFLVYWIMAFALYPVVGKLLVWITLFAIPLHFWGKGFQEIPKDHEGEEFFLGCSVRRHFAGDTVWIWPEPFGKLKITDVPLPAPPIGGIGGQSGTANQPPPVATPVSSQPAAAATPIASPVQPAHQGQRRRNRPNKP